MIPNHGQPEGFVGRSRPEETLGQGEGSSEDVDQELHKQFFKVKFSNHFRIILSVYCLTLPRFLLQRSFSSRKGSVKKGSKMLSSNDFPNCVE